MTRTGHAIGAFALLTLSWAGACFGGQTGASDGSSGVLDGNLEPGRCEPIDETLGLDDQLPAGYSARELLDRVADHTVAGYAWRNEVALSALTTNTEIHVITPEMADAELELRVRVRYDGGPRITLYAGDCHWGDAIALAVTISVEASDASVRRDVRGILYSTPAGAYAYRAARVFFYADDDQVPPQNAYVDRQRNCDEGPHEIRFAHDGTPQGSLCDDRGRVLVFPTACGGVAQTPFDEKSTAELPAPSETLAELSEHPRYRVTWPDGTTSTMELTLTPASDLACHLETEYAVAWSAALELRVEWLDEDIAYTQAAALTLIDGMTDFDNPPMELESQALLNDETIAMFAERLGEPRVAFADSILTIRRNPDGELERLFMFFGSRDVQEGENEVYARLPLEPIEPLE